ncbi:hypothetical protein TTHERM_00304260 (macronuclear) [Tetrahymena thermophila SB210]|uniref:Kinase domain protein n=1 Tax=Tetrahymena thermophila (strain SB210) TaxID=312017 RepID=I7MFX2_TETTS|nr:hypothetical protein TTHERM_00304260 [Tetrahymena thermophila SB210]EAS00757.4 hypothetical protein TTHERM_00304260 [Tetrahymena thermophila SB210]|eukprot:XP_001021002.4 hypothetical protein TTHERM_00304260 [Tetrahymena thermophila SB210]
MSRQELKNNETNQLLEIQTEQQLKRIYEHVDQKVFQSEEVGQEQKEEDEKEFDEEEKEEEEELSDNDLKSDEQDSSINQEDDFSDELEFEEQVGQSENQNDKSEEEEDDIEDQNSDYSSDSDYEVLQIFFDYTSITLEKLQQEDYKYCRYIELWGFHLNSLSTVCKAISKCKNLFALELPIDILDQRDIYKLGQELIKLNKLFELKFELKEDIQDKTYEQMIRFFKFCQKYTKLRLCLSITGEIQLKKQSIWQQRTLQNVSKLIILKQDAYVDKKDLKYLRKLLTKCVNLQHLYIDLLGTTLDSESLGQVLGNYEQLISLKIVHGHYDFYRNCNSFSIDKFLSNLANCRYLKNLDLEFSEEQFGFKRLVKGIKKLEQLATLRLKMYGDYMSDYLVIQFAKLKRLVCFSYINDEYTSKNKVNDCQLFRLITKHPDWFY